MSKNLSYITERFGVDNPLFEQLLEEAVKILNGIIFNGTTYEQDKEVVRIVKQIEDLKENIKK